MSLVHTITGEQGRFRRWSLYIFARYLEMPLLYWGYHLLRGRWRRLGQFRPVRALLCWAVAVPFGYAGDTARPLPVPRMLELIDSLDGPIAVGPCRCRAAHGACDHPLETDIVIRTGVEAWTRAFPDEYRVIGKGEAKRIVAACGDLGMWPMVFVHCPVHEHAASQSPSHPSPLPAETRQLDSVPELTDGDPPPPPPTGGRPPLPHGRSGVSRENEYVICNCCTCGCVPYMLNRELGQRCYPLLPGDYVAETDLARCTGHGACVDACPFGVRALVDGQAHLIEPCFGCGVCVAACPEDAIAMWAEER